MKNFDTRRTLFSTRYASFALLALSLGLAHTPEAKAPRRTSGQSFCATSNKVASSVYFLPHEKNYRTRSEFLAAVKMQGSGVRRDGRIQQYTGEVKPANPRCNGSVTGAAGRCLIPMISIAADPRHYRMGDIIQVPALKGKMIALPSGKKFKHPGYFVVDDTGGAIKGAGRFDFYTGDLTWKASNNDFGLRGAFPLTAKKLCKLDFKVVRHSQSEWNLAKTEIVDSLSEGSQAWSRVATSIRAGKGRL
jgi:3D (Asp-Asp-Asp) domain-containing protein